MPYTAIGVIAYTDTTKYNITYKQGTYHCILLLFLLLLLLSSMVSREEPFQLPGNEVGGHRFTTQIKVLLLYKNKKLCDNNRTAY